MKKILFCTDLSKNCFDLCQYVGAWVDQTDITVDIIHTYDPNHSNITAIDDPSAQMNMERGMQTHLEQCLNQFPEINRGQIHLESNYQWLNSIRQIARNIQADLIITGVKEKYTLMDRLFGSTVTKLIDDNNPPLLAIPYSRAYKPIGKILFTTESPTKSELTYAEEDAITWIYDHLAKDALPGIDILHISKDPSKEIEESNALMNLKFKSTHSTDVVMGIIDHIEKTPVDIIAVHHNQKTLWECIHQSSVAKNLLYKTKMPILFI